MSKNDHMELLEEIDHDMEDSNWDEDVVSHTPQLPKHRNDARKKADELREMLRLKRELKNIDIDSYDDY